MRNPFVGCVGGVVSADIAVSEHEREVEFYANVLTTGDEPLWRPDLMSSNATPVIGLGARTPEYSQLPTQWFPHFQVTDVAESAARALGASGQELMHGKTDSGESQWACLTDGEGAAFGIIPVVTEGAGDSKTLPTAGHIAWLSLFVRDIEAAVKFYRDVIGWSVGGQGVTEADCCEMLTECGTAACCIRQAREGQPWEAKWLIHLPVGNFQESRRRAVHGGGDVVHEEQGGKVAVIRDPVGVYFAIQQA